MDDVCVALAALAAILAILYYAARGERDALRAEVERLRADRERLEKALEYAVLFINDNLNLYAPECCNPDRVAQARSRWRAKGGTAAYTADVNDTARAALDAARGKAE